MSIHSGKVCVKNGSIVSCPVAWVRSAFSIQVSSLQRRGPLHLLRIAPRHCRGSTASTASTALYSSTALHPLHSTTLYSTPLAVRCVTPAADALRALTVVASTMTATEPPATVRTAFEPWAEGAHAPAAGRAGEPTGLHPRHLPEGPRRRAVEATVRLVDG
eukprot:7359815-Prymnesium_polylepis.1